MLFDRMIDSSPCSRYFTRSAALSNDDLPYHIVVGMPALSPTMETGTLSEWYVEEGSSFSAGESLAKIETDKASIDFEAQDDGFVGEWNSGCTFDSIAITWNSLQKPSHKGLIQSYLDIVLL